MTKINDFIPRIVIVGGGAGGLELAARLGKKLGRKNKATIILVDAMQMHLWKPLLHEVAAGTLNSNEDEVNYLAYASTHHFQYYHGYFEKLNRTEKKITLAPIYDDDNQEIIPQRELAYDILVIAVGSMANDFGIPGVNQYCYFLENYLQADQFQQKLFSTLQQLAYQKPDQQLNIAIVGGGATGVELAAELHFAIRQIAKYGIQFNPDAISLTLIEANDRLLPFLSTHISELIETELEKIGIKLLTNERIKAVTEAGFITQAGDLIPATIKVWAAGIKGPDFLKSLDGLETNTINQLIVNSSLQTTRDPAIFAFGDCASCPQVDDKKPVPPRAQAAHQQANFLVKAITDYINHKPLPQFKYHDYGSLISLSHYETIGNLMGRITKSIQIEGKFARLAYLSLYKMHQMALYGWWRMVLLSTANLLSRRVRPRLKLH